MSVYSIIQARGGSKGVPSKNIRPLGGFPLIAYSIAASKLSKTISHTIVSTDSEEIAEVSRKYGAEVPFLRPSKYAQDKSTDLDVFAHAISWLEKKEGVLHGPKVIGFETPFVTEIDKPEDFEYLEYQFKKNGSKLYNYLKKIKK